MIKAVYAIGAAVIFAAAFFTTLSLSDQVEARSTAGVKSDRADLRAVASDCSQNAWPYFEASCLTDRRRAFGQAAEVRQVSTDRISDAEQ